MNIQNIGILGTGKMGQAIIKGLSIEKPDLKILAYDIHKTPVLEKLCTYTQKPEELESCDVVLLCIKPQDFPKLKGTFQGKSKFISIAAGIEIQTILDIIPANNQSIARVMPNLAADVSQSATGIFCENKELAQTVIEIFDTIGKTYRLTKESDMHIVTALCGSGPAFVYSFLHALSEGGVLNGLSYDTALDMAIQTLTGAALSLKESKLHPSQARNKVTSPSGTTIAGLYELETGGFHATVMNAVDMACHRSLEIAIDKK